MALGQREPAVVADRAEHGHVGVVLDDGAQLAFVARAADLVQDHAGDAHVTVEGLIAEQQRRHAARHAARVDHEHDRQAEALGERRVAVAAVEREAVVQALVALDERGVGVGRVACEQRVDLVAAHQVQVEVEAGPRARARQPHRVDVVGALLERLHREAARGERGGEAEAHRRLARRLVRRRDHPARRRDGVHSCTALPGAKSSWGRKSSTRTPIVVSTNAAPTPPRPSSHSGQRGT